STNNGATWSSRVRVNDDTIGNGKSQFLPRIAIDQTSGNIAVSFYDCRNSPGNTTTELWATISADGGATFLPNVKVSAGVSSALERPHVGPWRWDGERSRGFECDRAGTILSRAGAVSSG